MREDSDDIIRRMSIRLESVKPGLRCLGIGFESVVYTDGDKVYKVFRENPLFYRYLGEQLEGRFVGCHRFFDVKLEEIDGLAVITYPYTESKAYTGGREDEMAEFLVESALCGVVFRDVKPINFRVFPDGMRFVDYGRDFLPFSETEFLYMCQRAFICLGSWSDPRFKDVVGRAQHTWDEDTLDGFIPFFNRVYRDYLDRSTVFHAIDSFRLPENRWIESMISSHSGVGTSVYAISDMSHELITRPVTEISDLSGDDMIILSDNFSLPVQLVQKLSTEVPLGGRIGLVIRNPFFGGDSKSVTDSLESAGIMVEAWEHSPPVPSDDGVSSHYAFLSCRRFEPVSDVSLMIKACYQDAGVIERLVRHLVSQLERPDRFLERVVIIDPKDDNFLRQYSEPDRDAMDAVMFRLLEEGTIDRCLVFPADEGTIRSVNSDWFDVDCDRSHSTRNIPVVPQLWGFEQCRGRYVLQADCDVMVVRRDRCHSYLSDMVEALENDPRTLSVSFNIAHDPSSETVLYAGNYCPEVRICLFDKERLLSHRPYPNSVVDGRLELSWYRSIERHQVDSGLRSVRGGDPRTFYIHPQNDRKVDVDQWMYILDRIESGAVADVQHENVDLQGRLTDWQIPKRREANIFVVCGRNLSNERFLRCWVSMDQQRCTDWGAVIIDDFSDNGMHEFIRNIVGTRRRVTFIRNSSRRMILSNIVHAVRDICDHPESVIVTLDMDDALTSRDALCILSKRYLLGHDMVSSTSLRIDRGILPYEIDFENVHSGRMGDVWLHVRSFRKYLFDAIDPSWFKDDGEWIDEFNELTFMVPMAEMASDPIQVRAPLYLWQPGRIRDVRHYIMNEHTKAVVSSRNPLNRLSFVEPFSRMLPPGMVVSMASEGDILILRHAEKERVRLIPSSEPGITPRGEDDSRIMGSALPRIDLYVVSEVRRTGETAHCLRQGNGGKGDIVVDSLLNRFPRELRVLIPKLKPDFDQSDAEITACREHARRIIMMLLERSEGRTLCAVTHDHMVRDLSSIFGGESGIPIYYLGGLVIPRAAMLRRLFELDSLCPDDSHPTDIHSVEIDITYRCNLGCTSCDRSCGTMDPGEDMSLDQIEGFIRESERRGHVWRRIRIMGGEPFMHPEIESILDAISGYVARNPVCFAEVYTNGTYEPGVSVPSNIAVHNTQKNERPNRFDPYNLAPCDLNPGYKGRGCWITTDCGVGLNVHGFYCCAAGAAVDRLFGFGLASQWPGDSGIEEGKKILCRYCGHGLHSKYVSREQRPNIGDIPLISDSWSEAYSRTNRGNMGRWNP